MNVEQENFFFSILRVGPAAAQVVGHEPRHRVAKSALITTRVGRGSSPGRVRTPTARRPSNSDLRHRPRRARSSTPISLGDAGHRLADAPQPPIGCQTPYSYSRNDRIENRLGQLNGDMPEVLRLERERQPDARVAEVAAQFARRATATAAAAAAASAVASVSRSRQPRNGRSRHGRNASELDAVVGEEPAHVRRRRPGRAWRSRLPCRAMSGVQSRSPPAPKTRRYCGSSRTIGTSASQVAADGCEDALAGRAGRGRTSARGRSGSRRPRSAERPPADARQPLERRVTSTARPGPAARRAASPPGPAPMMTTCRVIADPWATRSVGRRTDDRHVRDRGQVRPDFGRGANRMHTGRPSW